MMSACEVLGPQTTPAPGIIGLHSSDLVVYKDDYWLQDAEVKGASLYLTVSYSGGCAEHTFSLHTTEGWVNTNPPGKDLVLIHDGNGDACEAAIHETLQFDLSELRHPEAREIQLFIWPPPGDSFFTPVPRYRY